MKTFLRWMKISNLINCKAKEAVSQVYLDKKGKKQIIKFCLKKENSEFHKNQNKKSKNS